MNILTIARREPARIVGLVLAVLGVLAAFGLGVNEAQTAAIVAVVGAVLALVGGEVTRANVTPVGKRRRDEVGQASGNGILMFVVLVLVVVFLVIVIGRMI